MSALRAVRGSRMHAALMYAESVESFLPAIR